MNEKNIILKKAIKYRISYSGTKETDILYKKIILNKLNNLDKKELLLLSKLFNEISDLELFDILTNKLTKPVKYKELLEKLIN